MVILRKRVDGLGEATLARFVVRARRELRLTKAVNVLVTNSQEMRELNRRFRGKDRPTDVLSFPASKQIVGLAGEVAISREIAASNAVQLGHSTATEIKILALHGVLHLAGYDHEKDSGEMARKEQRLRKLLGLPAGLIERNGAKQLTSAKSTVLPRGRRKGR